MEPWMTWIEPLNALAGMTLVEVAQCQDCGRAYPASPRQRVRRCPRGHKMLRKSAWRLPHYPKSPPRQ